MQRKEDYNLGFTDNWLASILFRVVLQFNVV